MKKVKAVIHREWFFEIEDDEEPDYVIPNLIEEDCCCGNSDFSSEMWECLEYEEPTEEEIEENFDEDNQQDNESWDECIKKEME